MKERPSKKTKKKLLSASLEFDLKVTSNKKNAKDMFSQHFGNVENDNTQPHFKMAAKEIDKKYSKQLVLKNM